MNTPRTVQHKRALRLAYVLKPGLFDNEQAGQLLRFLPIDSPTESRGYLLEQIKAGVFQKLDIYENGERVGWTVYSIEDNEAGREFLSVASYGKGRGDLSREIIPMLEDFARKSGCHSMRLHTMRPGLCAKLAGLGWFHSEFVMRKEI